MILYPYQVRDMISQDIMRVDTGSDCLIANLSQVIYGAHITKPRQEKYIYIYCFLF